MAYFRTFVALELDDAVRAELGHMLAKLKLSGAHVGWIVPANLHLTLFFLGDAPEESIPALGRDLDAAASQVPFFTFNVANLGFFGPPKRPRILWTGVQSGPELQKLNAAVAAALKPHGYEPDPRPFAPHITLGRIRSGRNVLELTSLVGTHKTTAFGEVGVRRALLMRSHLDEPEARYSILHDSPLKGT